jgi:pimeloyl-ACP methyl ester carboxylesterase
MTHVAATAVAALICLSSCSSGGQANGSHPAVDAATTTTTSIATTSSAVTTTATASAASLARFYDQKLQWHGCGAGYQCSSLTVPIDYSSPSGATMSVAVIRKRSSGSHRGSLIVNPGGPGASGVDFARNCSSCFRGLTTHYDLVGFDPRGVGGSKPIRCLPTAQLTTYFNLPPYPTTDAQRAQAFKAAKALADGCWKRNGSYLEHVGTIDAARDMDVLRQALGDKKLTFYGASYGTYLGAKYAQLFPTHIRALVLDGAVNPAENTINADITQAGGFETDLRDFIAWCVRNSGCPLGGSSSAAYKSLADLAARVAAHPESSGGRVLGPGLFWIGLAAGFYESSNWPYLRTALHNAQQGDGLGMLSFSDLITDRRSDGTYSNLQESNTAINCIDRDSPKTISSYDAAAKQAAKSAPHFGPEIVFGSLPCAYWHVPPVEVAHPVHAPTAPAIVVIGTTHDPATPYVDSQRLAEQLPAVLVTFVGDGHTAYLRGTSCLSSLINNYMLALKVPPKGSQCG